MDTTQHSVELPEQARPTTIESVKFRDGMIVTADDLAAAVRYPASLLRTVLRSYLGCGVVCGLGLRVKEPPDKRATWVVCIDRGVAIDCQGYPIELCAPVELDLTPDVCGCDPVPDQVYIAVRRVTSEEAPKDACSCDLDAPHFDCRRIRDLVVVKAFTKADLEALPTVCRRPDPKTEAKPTSTSCATNPSEPSWSDAICETLTGCPECTCGQCWVLLGFLTLDKDKGITKKPDVGDRRWVKPIEVICTTVVEQIKQLQKQLEPINPDSTVVERIKAVEKNLKPMESQSATAEERIKSLEAQVASLMSSPPKEGVETTPPETT